MDASSMLLANSDPNAVLAGILDLAAQVVAADAYAVWRSFDGGTTWRAVALRGLSAGYRREIVTRSTGFSSVVHAVADVMTEPTLTRHRPVYEAEGIASLLSVPLMLEGKPSGTILFYWRERQELSEQRIGYATALSNLAATGLTLAELQEQNRRETQRLTFLAEASAVLASSLDYETTLLRVAELAVPAIADWCTVHVLENGVPTRIVSTHGDPGMVAFAEEYTRLYPEEIQPEHGVGKAIATGETEVVLHIDPEMLAAVARDEEHLRRLVELGMKSSLLVPLISRGVVLGAIRLLACAPSPGFTQADVSLAEDLARRAAVAIENAQLHRAVTEQETRLRLTHAAADMGSWSMDLTRNQVAWSPEFRALHGLREDAVASYEAGSALVHPDDREMVMETLRGILASDADQLAFEHRALRTDGRVFWNLSRGRIERDATGRPVGITGISMDVTERRQAEEALRRSEKLAAAGRLAATVAHEVNNPLEAIVNLVYIARHTPGLPEEAAVHLDTAEGELDRMAHIVRQTLGFYRESTSPRMVDLRTIVTDVLALYQSKAHTRGVRLEPEVPVEALEIHVNGGEIKQVVANLVSNAIDASPAGTTVRVRVMGMRDEAEIVVSDSGHGITEANLERLFEPFFTTKADVGTGLGLWVSKGIVEKHRGTIHVRSTTEGNARGTTFTVTLPVDAR